MSEEHEPGYPTGLVKTAGRAKATLQMLVGVCALGWLVWAFLLSPHMHNCAAISQHPAAAGPQFCYYVPPARVAFQIIADALGAATVIQLVYTLFTPGPDEALDPPPKFWWWFPRYPHDPSLVAPPARGQPACRSRASVLAGQQQWVGWVVVHGALVVDEGISMVTRTSRRLSFCAARSRLAEVAVGERVVRPSGNMAVGPQ